jgi:hypothetical protein
MSISCQQSISTLLPKVLCISLLTVSTLQECSERRHLSSLSSLLAMWLFISTTLALLNGMIQYNPRHLYLHSCCKNCLPPHNPQKLHRVYTYILYHYTDSFL